MKNFHTGDDFWLFGSDGVGAAQNDEETAVDVASSQRLMTAPSLSPALVLLSLMLEVVNDKDASSDTTHISSDAAIDEDDPGNATPLDPDGVAFVLKRFSLVVYCQRRRE